MTTFHDPQPLSRRAARERERAQSTQPTRDEAWDEAARRSTQSADENSGEAASTGRRARRAEGAPTRDEIPITDSPALEAPAAEGAAEESHAAESHRDEEPTALSESTSAPARPQIPSYDGPSFRNRSITPVPEAAPVESAALSEPVMTRRERRALERQREVQRADVEPAAAQTNDPTPSTAPAEPAPAEPYDSDAIDFLVRSGPIELPSVATIARREAAASVSSAPAVEPAAPAPRAIVPDLVQPEPTTPGLAAGAPTPKSSAELERALAEFDALTRAEPGDSMAAAPAPAILFAPQPDPDLPRSVSPVSGPITANALVLPSVPTLGNITGPMVSTGEILVTGSIDLPRGFGATGAHPAQFDHSEVDHLIDPRDRELTSTDSAPVRAMRAVSSHTATRGMIQTSKPRGNHLPTVLAITASAMAAGVVGLFVVGVVTGIF